MRKAERDALRAEIIKEGKKVVKLSLLDKLSVAKLAEEAALVTTTTTGSDIPEWAK